MNFLCGDVWILYSLWAFVLNQRMTEETLRARLRKNFASCGDGMPLNQDIPTGAMFDNVTFKDCLDLRREIFDQVRYISSGPGDEHHELFLR